MDDIRINNILPKRSKLRFNNVEVKFLYFNNKKVWPNTEAVGIPLIDTSGRTIGNQVEFNKINNTFYDKYNGHIDLNVEGTTEIITNNNNCLNVTGNNIKYNNYGVGSVSVNPKDTEKYKSSTVTIRCNELIFEHYKGTQTNNVDASGTRNIQVTIKSRYNGNLLNITKDNIKTDCNWITINNDITVDRSTNTIIFSYNVAQYANTVDLRSGNITIKPTMPNDMHDIKNSYVPELSYRITQSAVETKTLYIKYADNANINNYVDLYCINGDTDHLKNDDSRHKSMCELALFDSTGNSVDAVFKSSNTNYVTVQNSHICVLKVGETGSYGSSEITATPVHSERDVIYDIKPVVVHMNYVTFDVNKTSTTFDWNDTHSQSSTITVTKNGYSDIDKVSLSAHSTIIGAQIVNNTVLYNFKNPNKIKQPINTNFSLMYFVGNDITLYKEIELTQSACPYNLIEQNGVDFKITGPETLQYGETGTYVLSMTNFNKSDISRTRWISNNSNVKITGNDGDIKVTVTNNLPGEDTSSKVRIGCIVMDMVSNQKQLKLDITCHSQKSKYIEFTDTTPISTVIINGKQSKPNLIRVNYKTTDNNQVLNNIKLHLDDADITIKNKTNSYIEFELQNVNDSFYGDKQISISCDGYKQKDISTRTLHVDNYSLRFNDSTSPYMQSKTYNATGESTKYEDNPKLKYIYTVNGDSTKKIFNNSSRDDFNVNYSNKDMITKVYLSNGFFDVDLNDNTSTNKRSDIVIVTHNIYPELSLKLNVEQAAKAITYATSVSIRNTSNGDVLSNGNTIYMQTNSQMQNLEAYVQPFDYSSTYAWSILKNDLNGNSTPSKYSTKSVKLDISNPSSQKCTLSVKKSNTEDITTTANIEVCSAITGISISTPINSTVGKETRVPITVSGASSNNPLTWSISNNDKINATIDKNNKQLVINSNTEFSGNITIYCTDKLGNKVSTIVHVENKPESPKFIYATELTSIVPSSDSTVKWIPSTVENGMQTFITKIEGIIDDDDRLNLVAQVKPSNYDAGYTWKLRGTGGSTAHTVTNIVNVPLESKEDYLLYNCEVQTSDTNTVNKTIAIKWTDPLTHIQLNCPPTDTGGGYTYSNDITSGENIGEPLTFTFYKGDEERLYTISSNTKYGKLRNETSKYNTTKFVLRNLDSPSRQMDVSLTSQSPQIDWEDKYLRFTPSNIGKFRYKLVVTDLFGWSFTKEIIIKVVNKENTYPDVAYNQFLIVNNTDTAINILVNKQTNNEEPVGINHGVTLGKINSNEYRIFVLPNNYSTCDIYYAPVDYGNENWIYGAPIDKQQPRFRLSTIGDVFEEF